jgi:hypothetical protein
MLLVSCDSDELMLKQRASTYHVASKQLMGQMSSFIDRHFPSGSEIPDNTTLPAIAVRLLFLTLIIEFLSIRFLHSLCLVAISIYLSICLSHSLYLTHSRIFHLQRDDSKKGKTVTKKTAKPNKKKKSKNDNDDNDDDDEAGPSQSNDQSTMETSGDPDYIPLKSLLQDLMNLSVQQPHDPYMVGAYSTLH